MVAECSAASRAAAEAAADASSVTAASLRESLRTDDAAAAADLSSLAMLRKIARAQRTAGAEEEDEDEEEEEDYAVSSECETASSQPTAAAASASATCLSDAATSEAARDDDTASIVSSVEKAEEEEEEEEEDVLQASFSSMPALLDGCDLDAAVAEEEADAAAAYTKDWHPLRSAFDGAAPLASFLSTRAFAPVAGAVGGRTERSSCGGVVVYLDEAERAAPQGVHASWPLVGSMGQTPGSMMMIVQPSAGGLFGDAERTVSLSHVQPMQPVA